MKDGAKITIDAAGRLVIPKAIRERAGLVPGVPLQVRFREGRIEIEPAPRAVRMRRKGPLKIAEPADETTEALTEEEVERTKSAVRTGRG